MSRVPAVEVVDEFDLHLVERRIDREIETVSHLAVAMDRIDGVDVADLLTVDDEPELRGALVLIAGDPHLEPWPKPCR